MKDMLAVIVSISGLLTIVSGFFFTLYKILKKFDTVEESSKCRKEENVIIINSVFAICDGLTQLGANGPVTKAKESLQEYIIKRGG
jgi:hypothetical protein